MHVIQKMAKKGWPTTELRSWNGPHRVLTSISLNTFGIIWTEMSLKVKEQVLRRSDQLFLRLGGILTSKLSPH